MIALIRNILVFLILSLITISLFQCGFFEDKKNNNPDSKYKNLDPNVKYVGMATCKQCHFDKYATFIETGMGKSFDKASKKKSSAKFDQHSVVYDKFSDLSYHPFWSGDTMKIMEFRMDGKDTTFKRIEKVDYIIGSGQHTNSHIFNTNGYLHQMPMTFYTQEEKWDLPPGFENGSNTRFSRKIGLECMSCHNSLPAFVQGSENKFDSVPNGIGCERCHGPGEIHVKEKTQGIIVETLKYIDYSIVNPAKLPIDLQFDVCQRCHLQGNTVLKEGKSFYDFRPGMKLSDIMATFLPKYEGAEDEFIMASHADRLKMSKCFKVAPSLKGENTLKPYKDALTCVTCHNPHISVKATGKEIFNNACQNCHGEINVVCTEKQVVRNQVADNCISCHMPKSGAIDIPHVTVTDHFIRTPVKKADIAGVQKFIGLFAINEKNPGTKVKAEAYMNQYEKFDHNPVLLDSAKKYLSDKTIDEIRINLSLLVRLYFLKGDYDKIIFYANKFQPDTLLNVLLNHKSMMNDDAWTCYRIGEAYMPRPSAKNNITDKPEIELNEQRGIRALNFYQKASELAPYIYDFKIKYGGQLFALNKTDDAKKIFEAIIKENPEYAPAFSNLGYYYFGQHNYQKAEWYYNKALAIDPDYQTAIVNKIRLLVYAKRINEAKTEVKKLTAVKKDISSEEEIRILKIIVPEMQEEN